MTKSSKPRASRRTSRKPSTKAAAKAAAPAEKSGGNGQAAAAKPAAPAAPPAAPVVQPGQPGQPQLVPVGDMKPAEVKKLRDAETQILKLMAEIGDLTMQIDQGRQRQAQLGDEVRRRRQDLSAMMRGTVIAHGFDPDNEKFNLNPETGKIERIVRG